MTMVCTRMRRSPAADVYRRAAWTVIAYIQIQDSELKRIPEIVQ